MAVHYWDFCVDMGEEWFSLSALIVGEWWCGLPSLSFRPFLFYLHNLRSLTTDQDDEVYDRLSYALQLSNGCKNILNFFLALKNLYGHP